MKSKNQTLAWVMLLVLALTWGSSYILMKKSLIAFTPEQLACLRITISTLAFFPFFLYHFRKIDWSKWRALVVVGLFGSFIPAFLFSTAQTQISSSMAGLLSSLTPLFTLLLGLLFFGLQIARERILGIVLGLVGAVFLILTNLNTGLSGNVWYALLVIFATACYATSSNTVQAHLKSMNAIQISSAAFVLVGLPAVIYLVQSNFIQVMQTHPHAWYSLGYVSILSIFGTFLASLIFFYLVKSTDAIFASTVSYLIPIIALIWGYVDGEIITVYQFLGMGLILGGVYLSRRKN